MERAASKLATLNDDRLFEEISKGIGLIIENAEGLDNTAHRLAQIGERRVAQLCAGLAEEEAAKVLILVDAVRCPRKHPYQKKRNQVFKNFYSHLAKGIYAKACKWSVPDFKFMREYVEDERNAWFLDGPNGDDWIFRNHILANREGSMYVDYVQDITEKDEKNRLCSWISPLEYGEISYTHMSPDSLKISRAIVHSGATTPKGLRIVASEWRGFIPQDQTTDQELQDKNISTLLLLEKNKLCSDLEDPVKSIMVNKWMFPLWPFDLAEQGDLKNLRDTRTKRIALREKMQAERDPRPVISRQKIEELTNIYLKWEKELEKLTDDYLRQEAHPSGLRLISSSVYVKAQSLDSYREIEIKLRKLTLEERMDLKALAWFGRDTRVDWPYCHEHARNTSVNRDYNYEIGLGNYWLTGLERYEDVPDNS